MTKLQSLILKSVKICQKGVTSTKQRTSVAHQQLYFVTLMYEHSSSNYLYSDGSKSQNVVGFAMVYGNNLKLPYAQSYQ